MSERDTESRRRSVDWGKWIKRVLAVAFVVAVVAGLVYSFLPKPMLVDARTVEVGPMEVTVDEDGRTRVIDQYVVSAPLSGNLARIELRAGDEVKAGDVIARIEPAVAPLMDARSVAETQARLRAAEAAVRQAKATTRRAEVARNFADGKLEDAQALARRGSVSRTALEEAKVEAKSREQELTSARFGERVAKGEVEMARAVLRRIDRRGEDGNGEAEEDAFEVIAPASGRVLEVAQTSEGPVAAGQPLLEIADPSHLEVVADVLTTDAVQISAGDRVYLDGWGGEMRLDGRVRLVEPSAFTRVSALGVEEQRVNVLIDLAGDPAVRTALGDGYRVEVGVVIWSEEAVTRVPVSALFRDGEGWGAFVVEDGRATTRSVQVGRRHGLVAQVLEGLREGDRVIVHPDEAIADGVQVEVP